MLVIEVELLTGRYAATAHDDRGRAEWPPHPARFFSALVAALHDREPVDPGERAALLWLEKQPAPALDVEVESDERVGRRDVHDVFVPVNDVTVVGNDGSTERRAKVTALDLKAAVALVPEHRTRQVRTFPVYVPARRDLAFIWPEQPDPPVRKALESLCARVTRLGHSSSLVRCAITERDIAPTLVPSSNGKYSLRVVGDGQLDRLEKEFAVHEAFRSRVLPAKPQLYALPLKSRQEANIASSIFSDEWIVFQRRGGARLRSSRGADLARALRAALIETHGAATLPPILSGHGSNGVPADTPHLAFVACPDVGHSYADGGIMGCAIVLPRVFSIDDRRTLMRLIAAWETKCSVEGIVELGGEGFPPVAFERVGLSEKQALQPRRWSRPSARYITATPIALDRHPGNLRSNLAGTAHRAALEAQRCIADACERIGLPRPVEVEISLAPLIAGAQPVREFLPWPANPGRHPRTRVHARIDFDREVRGPVLLGNGRFFGLGLCLPVHDDRAGR